MNIPNTCVHEQAVSQAALKGEEPGFRSIPEGCPPTCTFETAVSMLPALGETKDFGASLICSTPEASGVASGECGVRKEEKAGGEPPDATASWMHSGLIAPAPTAPFTQRRPPVSSVPGMTTRGGDFSTASAPQGSVPAVRPGLETLAGAMGGNLVPADASSVLRRSTNQKSAILGLGDLKETLSPNNPGNQNETPSALPTAGLRSVTGKFLRVLDGPFQPQACETDPSTARSVGGEPAGMSAAQTIAAMKPAAPSDDFACLTVQELPSSAARGKECSSSGPGLTAQDLRGGIDQSVVFGVFPDTRSESSVAAGSARLLGSESISIAEAGDVETWLRHVEMRVRQLESSGSNRLTLVLQSDAHREIHLDFRLRNGQVEAHARCERDCFTQLSAEWGQLQQALSASGVRLAALMALPDRSAAPFGSGSGPFDAAANSDQQSNPRPEREEFCLSQEEHPQKSGLRRRLRDLPIGSTRLLERWA